MIETYRFEPTKLKRVTVRDGEFITWIQKGIEGPDCMASFEEFRPGEPHGYFVFWYDEVHFGLSGSAVCTYRLPPTFEEEHTLQVGAGDLYFLPTGLHNEWQVLGDEPYRFLWVCMPRPKGFESLV